MKRLSLLAAAGLFAAAASTPTGMPGWQPPARPRESRRRHHQQPRRHLTKAGPGRSGHKGKGRWPKRNTGPIHYGSGHRNLRKLLGTRD